MNLILKKEDLQIKYEPKDTKQPYRVIFPKDNDYIILYFCKTKEIARNFISDFDFNKYMGK